MTSPEYIVLTIGAYLLGSVPFGIIFAKLFGGQDPRKVGSRNIGATNVRRSAGGVAAALTLVADILKGAGPVHVAGLLGGDIMLVSLTAFAAFLGHLYPVFLGFRGGKGVATACGALFVISPPATILALLVFIIAVAVKRYVSLGSMIAAASMPVFISVFPAYRDYTSLAMLIAVFIIMRHRENIKRLAAGVEKKL